MRTYSKLLQNVAEHGSIVALFRIAKRSIKNPKGALSYSHLVIFLPFFSETII